MANYITKVCERLQRAPLYTARAQKRNYAAVLFSSKDEVVSFRFTENGVAIREKDTARRVDTPSGLIEMAGWFFGRGTDYETPLRRAEECSGDDPPQYPDATSSSSRTTTATSPMPS